MLNPSRFLGLVGLFAPLAVALSACVSIIGLPEVPNLAEGDSPESGPPRTDSAVDPSRDGSADTALDTGLDVDIASPDGEGGPDGGQTKPPSCKERTAPGIHDCGPFTSPATRGTEDCCASPLVNSDRTSFNRLFIQGSPVGASASVSPFRLDKYEVTAGRFRAFVAAKFSPTLGSGKHTHLTDSMGNVGLVLAEGGFEQGWREAAFDPNMTAFLAVNDTKSTYRASPPDDRRPVNLVTWAEAYAFCIWDGGFLPTEAEWIYAAANGSEQRQWPFGSQNPLGTPGNENLAIIEHNYPPGNTKAMNNTVNQIAPVGFPMNGKSVFGQSDLAGNLQEYVLDKGNGNPNAFPNSPTATLCADCATFSGGQVIVRGGNYGDPPFAPITGNTVRGLNAVARADYQGFRCARSPL